ncbi:MAG: hypothetical protein FWD05_07005 [Oscillospiraceae bacterium]|nr:hypothetical protein [Oscillospiraceae bacterium]
MINMIRADLYRVSKSWVTYAPFAGLLLFQLIMVILSEPLDAGASVEMVHSLLSYGNFFFVIAMLPFVFCVSVPIFADSTMKNDISWGMSRTKLYVSKVLIMALLSFLLYLFYIGTGIVLAVITVGFGSTSAGFWPSLFQAMGAQMVGIFALCSLMVFLSFLLKKPYVLTEVLALFLILPQLINWILSLIDLDAPWVLYFELMSNIQRFADFSLLDSRTILVAFGVIAVWMTAPLVLGITLLRRADIK